VATDPGAEGGINRRVTQAKAHHFIPVAHLARFSASADTVPIRRRVLHVYDKRSGAFRSAKTEKTAYVNDLYTTRHPEMAGVEPVPEQIVSAVLDPANKDAWMEDLKAEIERRGVSAMREIGDWEAGPRMTSGEDRAPLLIYAGLLLAQHPTMMLARAAALKERFWAAASARRRWLPPLEAAWDEMFRVIGVGAVIHDAFAAAYELDPLAWKVIRWPGHSGLVLGDTGVAASYRPDRLGVGEVWASGAKFLLPVDASTLVVLSGFSLGLCVVEDRSGPDADQEIGAMNFVSWARSQSEVYAAHREDLERARRWLGPIDPNAEFAAQLQVRTSVLPEFDVNDRGELTIHPPSDYVGDEVQRRFEARFHAGASGPNEAIVS
jgi:hypothetical protein